MSTHMFPKKDHRFMHLAEFKILVLCVDKLVSVSEVSSVVQISSHSIIHSEEKPKLISSKYL